MLVNSSDVLLLKCAALLLLGSHGITHHASSLISLASLAGVQLCKLCNADCAHKLSHSQKSQQSQCTLGLLMYAQTIVNTDMQLPQPAYVYQLNSPSLTHPAG